MAKKSKKATAGIVLPGGKNPAQLEEWLLINTRARTFTDRSAQARKGITRGGRSGSKRAAIASFA